MPREVTPPDAPNSGSITYGESPRDEQGRKYIDWPDGSRFYLRPDAGSPLYFQGSNGGLFHNPDNWNPKTGQWEPGGVNWGALGPWLGLAAIGGATAAAAMSSTVPSAVASQAGATAGAGSGAAATGAGVGIGETGAVSGLAGSGLAGELGGIGATTVTAGGVGMPIVQGANSGGILSSLGGLKGAAKTAGKLGTVLGGINNARAANQQATDQTRILQKNYELGAPAKRLDTSRKASLLANFQPVKAQWGGPGSGLRGEHVNFTGGFSNPDLYSPDTKALAQDVMHKQLLASLNGEDKLPDAGHSSVWDKILGGIGTGASILGAFA